MQAMSHTNARSNAAPDGFTAITPFLMVEGADSILEFMRKVFSAEDVLVLRHGDGTLWHAQLRIGDAMLMLADAMGKKEHVMPASLYMYVQDVDAVYQRALDAGAESVMEPADQFYGDRNAGVRDDAGNVWWIAQQVETLSKDEMISRGRAFEKSCAAGTAE